jgi:hypothetical protein
VSEVHRSPWVDDEIADLKQMATKFFEGDINHPARKVRTSVNPSLQHKLFVTAQIAQSGRGPLPDGSTRMWSPITSTLIMGRTDAVLVDPAHDHRAGRGGWRLGGGLRAKPAPDLRHPRTR